MSLSTVKKFLLAGTALVAVAAISSPAHAAALTLTGNGTWALDTGTTGAQAAVASDTINVDTFALTVTNDGTASDDDTDHGDAGSDAAGDAIKNTFTLGAVTGSTGSVAITTGSANDLTVGATSVIYGGTGSLSVANRDVDGAAVTATIAGALTNVGGGTLAVTNNETDATKNVALTVGGNTTVVGATTVTAGAFTNANATLTNSGATNTYTGLVTITGGSGTNATAALVLNGGAGTNTFTGGIVLDDGAAGNAALTVSDAGAKVIAGTVDAVAAGKGEINTNSADLTTFSDNVGGSSAATGLRAINLNGNGGTTFSGTTRAGTITANTAGTNTFTGAVTATSLAIDGVGGTTTLSAASTIGTTSFSAGNTLNVNGTLTGNINFGGVDAAVVTVADGSNITGTVNSTVDAGGVLTLSGDSTVSGAVGATNNLIDIVAGASGKTANFTAAVKSDALHVDAGTVNLDATTSNTITLTTFTGAGTLALDGSLTGDIDFDDNDGTVTIASGKSLTGAVDNGSGAGNKGTLTLSGGTQTVSGLVGDTQSLKEVKSGQASGANTSFTSLVKATTLSIGAGTATLNGGFTGTTANFTGDGVIHLAAGQTITGAVDTNTNNTGTFVFDGNGTVSTTFGASHTLKSLTVSGTGTTGTVTGNLIAANTTTVGGNTLATGGTFSLGATQTLNAVITGAAANGKVTSTGNATITTGATLAITVDAGYSPAAGFSHDYTFVDGNNAGSGVGTVTITGPATWSFTQVANTHDLVVTATRLGLSAVGDSANNDSVGTALDIIGTSGDAALTQVNDDIANAATAADVNAILGTLTPTVDGGAQMTALDVGAQVQDVTETRMASLRNGNGTSGMAAGASMNGVSMWIQGYGQHAEQDLRSGIAGYDADTWGGAVGFDTANLVDDGVIGFAISYGNAQVDSDNLNTTATDVDSYGFTLYGTKTLQDKMFVDGQLGYAYNDIDSVRHNVGGPGSGINANGGTHSDQFSAKAELGRDYAVDYGTILTPTVSAAYTYLNTAGYTETGSGANLVVHENDVQALNLGIGVKAAWKLKNSDGSLMKPTLRVGYAYDAIGDDIEITSNFAGAAAGTNPSFVTNGADPARSAFNAGAGFTYMTTANWDFSANYNYTGKEDYSAHTGTVRLTSHF